MDFNTNSSELPVVALNETNASPGAGSWRSTAETVQRALETYGCFVVDCDKIQLSEDDQLHKAMFGLLEELFRLPWETKREYTSELTGFGYGGKYPAFPLFESFGIEDGESLEAAKEFATLMWPHGHESFCETLHEYCKLLLKLDHMVMRLVLSSYGLDKYCDSLIDSSFYMTRLIKYNSPDQDVETVVGLTPHRDKGFLGVIGSNEVKGLQIETRDGQWLDFEPTPSKFLVIVGEAFVAWSNGRIYCPLHRVIARGFKDRYSIAIFSFIRGILQVPEELVDDQNPLKFKSFSNLEFLDYCKQVHTTLKDAIHSYCGI